VNTNAVSRSLAVASLLLAAPALAYEYGPFEIVGFIKDEYSLCDNCSAGIVNKAAYDTRGVLSPPVPMLNQGGDSEGTGRNLFLADLTIGVSHEFDNAFKIAAKTSGPRRCRIQWAMFADQHDTPLPHFRPAARMGGLFH